jgi:hypothetical protein
MAIANTPPTDRPAPGQTRIVLIGRDAGNDLVLQIGRAHV